ncbi:MAG: hypothetical protein IJ418_11120 [Clostridia bacterium]|nr:hypothetical protein [Clostridia bacterium]
MPKLKLTEQQMKTRQFQAVVAKQLVLMDYSKDQLAKLIRISRSSLWEKLDNPSKFRVGELQALHHVLKFSEEERHILF